MANAAVDLTWGLKPAAAISMVHGTRQAHGKVMPGSREPKLIMLLPLP